MRTKKKDASYVAMVWEGATESTKAFSQRVEEFPKLLMILRGLGLYVIVPGSCNEHLNKTLELSNIKPVKF